MRHFGDHVEQCRQITAGQVIRGTAAERNQQIDQHHAAVLATKQTLEWRHDHYRRPLGFAGLLQLLPDRGLFQVTEHHQTEKRA
ncbi:hypothetical protein D3C75_906180 [compost metagenome]